MDAGSATTRDLGAFDADVVWRPIAPASRVIWGAGGSIPIAAVGLAITAAAASATAAAAVIALVLTVGAVGLWWLLVSRRYRAWGYAERDADLLLRRGVLLKRLTIVPYGRMQFVDVRQGPLARYLGLASVKLHTAAAATDAQIPLLEEEEARRLRDRLTALGEARAAGV